MTEPSDIDAAPSPAPEPPARRGRVGRIAGMLAAAAVVAGTLGVAVIGTAWYSEAGLRWLLRHVPGITAVDVHGSLGGGDLAVGSLQVMAGATQVDIVRLHVTGLALHPP